MKALVIGTCPWIKSSHGAITKSIANTLSKDSTVVVLGLNHDATMFGDGVKSSINNPGMNEIEILCLSKDASISTITVYEIYKNWKCSPLCLRAKSNLKGINERITIPCRSSV